MGIFEGEAKGVLKGFITVVRGFRLFQTKKLVTKEVKVQGVIGSGLFPSGSNQAPSLNFCTYLFNTLKSAKGSIHAKRLQAGWNNDYLLAILKS